MYPAPSCRLELSNHPFPLEDAEETEQGLRNLNLVLICSLFTLQKSVLVAGLDQTLTHFFCGTGLSGYHPCICQQSNISEVLDRIRLLRCGSALEKPGKMIGDAVDEGGSM
ncbi:hypothetical protein EJB05_34620, partial [Eragrostis curvula]